MNPKYLRELADLADPDQLWRLSDLKQMELPPEKRKQLDTGVALRRYAEHMRRLRELLGTDKSLLLTPLSLNGTDVRSVLTPPEVLVRAYKASQPTAPQLPSD